MMKKKHRRAVYDVIVRIITPIYCIFYYPATSIWKFTNWLKIKMRVRDEDSDYQPKEKKDNGNH